MRMELLKIIPKLSILFLLSITSVSAQPMPVIEGSVFNFESKIIMSCDVYPYKDNNNIEEGEKVLRTLEYLITEIYYEDEMIYYNISVGDYTGSDHRTMSVNQLKNAVHPTFEELTGLDTFPNPRVGEIYYNWYIPLFIKPDFEEMNNVIRENLYREDENHLNEAIEVEFMGKNSIEKGAEKLDSDNRKLSIYLYFINDVNGTPWEIKVWKEWEYSRNGLLKYLVIKKETKLVESDDWCSFEAILKNTDSLFSPFYGTEINIFLFIVPLFVIFLWINRKKITKNF